MKGCWLTVDHLLNGNPLLKELVRGVYGADMDPIPYYLTESWFSVTVMHAADEDTRPTLYFRTRARVVGDLLVVEPVMCIRNSCPIHGGRDVGTLSLYMEKSKSCNSAACLLRLEIMDVIGVDPDLVGWPGYGWRVGLQPSEVLGKLQQNFQCWVHYHDVADDWMAGSTADLVDSHVRALHNLMFLKSRYSSKQAPEDRRNYNEVFHNRSDRYGVSLRCFDGIPRAHDEVEWRHVEGVFKALKGVCRVEVAS